MATISHMGKSLVNGTSYSIDNGRLLVNGVGYSIEKGKTLINGTSREISFDDGKLYLYRYGDTCNAVTGGYVQGTFYNNASISFASNYVQLHSYRACLCTQNKIDLSGYSKMGVHFKYVLGRAVTGAGAFAYGQARTNVMSYGTVWDSRDWIAEDFRDGAREYGEEVRLYPLTTKVNDYFYFACDDNYCNAYLQIYELWFE